MAASAFTVRKLVGFFLRARSFGAPTSRSVSRTRPEPRTGAIAARTEMGGCSLSCAAESSTGSKGLLSASYWIDGRRSLVGDSMLTALTRVSSLSSNVKETGPSAAGASQYVAYHRATSHY